jgi:GNAT superfamily N-acetyltransferase
MIKEIKTIEEFSGVSSPLIPRIFSAFKYKTGSDNAWRQVDDEGNTIALVSSVDGNFTLIASEQTYIEEIEEFLQFFGCKSLTSNVKLASSAKSYSLMKFVGDENEKCDERFTILNVGSTVSAYRGYHAVLFMDMGDDFDNWYCDFSRKIINNDAKAVALNQFEIYLSITIAPMIFENTAIISGVYTLRGFRNRGYSKATVYKLIEELKKDNITEIYLWCEKELEEFYKKLCFEKTGYIYSETEF